ncbi:hypothetical protein QFZ22_004715 [Streptomyces canus]|uniref:Secreted protein n=1 Tax=Streptomyces canus TaxID=58343 RepID=A0AAW8FHK1_9ACTN|nr:hypothetical protein [Streptomyces canus]
MTRPRAIVLRGASLCCLVLLRLFRARPAGHPVPPRDAPSEGVCPPSVHRRGCHRGWQQDCHGTANEADARSEEWTGRLSTLYRRLLTARAGPPSLALPEDGWWISTRGGSRCGARSRGATLVERGRAARVQWSSPGLKHGPPPPRPVQHSSAWPAVRSAVDQVKWGTLPLTRLRQLLPQAPARRPRAAAGARTRRCRGACHCQVHPPRHGSAGRRPYDIRQAAAQQRAREGDVRTTLRSVATTW